MLTKRAVIVDAIRSPIGKLSGKLSSIRADDLAALAIKELINRNSVLNQRDIEEVIFGCTNQAGEDNRNVARMAALLAGLPETVAGCTLNRLCGSGLEAINYASSLIKLGHGNIYISGGVENMSRSPLVMMKPDKAFQKGNQQLVDSMIGWRFPNPKMKDLHGLDSLGQTAENVADVYNISRKDQDYFALSSQHKYQKNMNKLQDEIFTIKSQDGDINKDEHPRVNSTYEKLSSLKPSFIEDGTVTAGNSSGINDGSAALLILESNAAQTLEFKPIVEVIDFAVSGVSPKFMGLGPVEAVKKLIAKTKINLKDIGLIEINEAFASQAIACINLLNLDISKVNVNGGAIALGHPLGCSGARIMTTLIYEMRRRNVEFGLATMCIGVGQGIATLVKLVN